MPRSSRNQESPSRAALYAISLAAAMLFGCAKPTEPAKPDGGKPANEASGRSGEGTAKQAAAGKYENGRAVLEAMAAVYRQAKTYQDNGVVRLVAQSDGEKPYDKRYEFSAAFERPNKIHLDAYRAHVRCDGAKYRAFIEDLRGQVVEKDAPEKLDFKSIYCDPVLLRFISLGGPAGGPPQPTLFWEKKPLDILLAGAEEPVLAESGEIDGGKCYRVQIRRPDGLVVFWIDQETLALRRVVFPTDVLRSYLAQEMGGEVTNASLIADFAGAAFDRPVDRKAFEFEVPRDGEARILPYFLPPHPGQLIGRKAPPFEFADESGRGITPQSLAGKVAALLFWSPQSGDYAPILADLQKLSEDFRNEPGAAFCAVCQDDPNADKKELDALRRAAKFRLPMYFAKGKTESEFDGFSDVVFLLGPDGTVQDYEMASEAGLSAVLRKKIEDLLAGRSVADEAAERYRKELKEYEKAVAAFASGASPAVAAAQAKLAEPSAPQKFKLKPLWKCADLKDPGNIVVLREPKRPPRLLVVCPPNEVAEVGLDGKVGTVHKLELSGDEVVTNLRTFTTAAGKTYAAVFAGMQQRMRLFDLEDKQRMIYPEDALQNPHSGIADVELFDLDGDGAPEIYIGFWGVVGVHAVSLEGKQLWGNRSLANVAHLAAAPADENGRRDLICTNILNEQNASLVVLGGQGRRTGVEFALGKRAVHYILGADLAGDGSLLWCGAAAAKMGENAALGFTLQGQELWNYDLPGGVQTRPIEQIVAGRVTRGGPGQWLLPGPDGSIHILAADGTLYDRFNFGAVLQGLATVEIGGKPVLLISSPNGLEAFTVE